MGKENKAKRRRKEEDAAAKAASRQKTALHAFMDDIRYGRSLSVDFFRRNAWMLMIFIVAIISLMGLRYKNKTKMLEIKNLTTELKHAESEKLQEKAAYMSLIRETEMKRLVENKGLGLQFQEQPPYELETE